MTSPACAGPGGATVIGRIVLAAGLMTASLDACSPMSESAAIESYLNSVAQFRIAADKAVACRNAAAESPRYQVLFRHVPLADIDAASLRQMADRSFATGEESALLGGWIESLNHCTRPLLQATAVTLPNLGPIIEASLNNDDAVYVGLVQHRLAWGEAVLRLKSNRTKMRAELLAGADRILEQSIERQQGTLNRRANLLSSVIRIIP